MQQHGAAHADRGPVLVSRGGDEHDAGERGDVGPDGLRDRSPVVAYRCRQDSMWSCETIGMGLAPMLGYQPSAWVADPGLWLRRIHPDDRERVARERLEASRRGDLVTEYRVRAADGEDRWVHDRARIEDGTAYGVLVDMTAHRQADRAVESSFELASRRADELAHAHTVNDALIHLFAHDVRSPLTAAIGFVSTMLRTDVEIDEEQRQYLLERLGSSLDRMRLMVADLEAYWDTDAAGTSEVVDLGALVTEVVEEAAAEVEVDLVPGQRVRAVPSLLRRALSGLLDNAVTHGGGRAVEVASRWEGDDAVVEVTDHGPGVSDVDKGRVFDPFVRLVDDGTPGRGLGLALVRRVAILHGGRADVVDTPGGGATFVVRLPQGDEPGPRLVNG